MIQTCLCLVVAVLSAGCLHSKIQKQAAEVLGCPESSIQITEPEPHRYQVTGCGRLAICRASEEDGADLTCAGGAPQ